MRPTTDHRPLILKAAAHHFAKRPYHEVLMEDVAGTAGVAKGTLYRFYRDKEQLYAAVCLSSLDQLRGELQSAARAPESPVARLRRMVLCIAGYFHAHRDLFGVMQREWGCVSPPNRAEFLARRMATRDAFADVIREGQAAGELRPGMEANATADMLLGMIRALLRFGSGRMEPADNAKAILEVFFHGTVVARRSGNGTRKR